MEDIFNKLKPVGQNTLDTLMKWLKDSNVVPKNEEDNTRKMFDSVKNKSNVEFAEFQNVLTGLADKTKVSMDELVKKLLASGPDLLKNIQGAAGSAVTAGMAAVQGLAK